MNRRWFREYALPESSYHAAGLADRGAVFMCIAGRVRPLWAPYKVHKQEEQIDAEPPQKVPRVEEEMDFLVMIDAEEDDEELRALYLNPELEEEFEDALLAGCRREINRKGPKWQSTEGEKKILAGVMKEMANLIKVKQALEPLDRVKSDEVRRSTPERIVGSRMILTSKIDDTESEIVKARLC
eukprot:3120235-Pyramimonas_sp.AAC.1